jgi:hypothetical protein
MEVCLLKRVQLLRVLKLEQTFCYTDLHCDTETQKKLSKIALTNNIVFCEISGSHGVEYEDDSFLGYSVV